MLNGETAILIKVVSVYRADATKASFFLFLFFLDTHF